MANKYLFQNIFFFMSTKQQQKKKKCLFPKIECAHYLGCVPCKNRRQNTILNFPLGIGWRCRLLVFRGFFRENRLGVGTIFGYFQAGGPTWKGLKHGLLCTHGRGTSCGAPKLAPICRWSGPETRDGKLLLLALPSRQTPWTKLSISQ